MVVRCGTDGLCCFGVAAAVGSTSMVIRKRLDYRGFQLVALVIGPLANERLLLIENGCFAAPGG